MLRKTGPSSVSLLICESVLNETTGAVSAVRIMDVLTVGSLSRAVRFFVVSYLHSHTIDFAQHVAQVQMLGLRDGQWISVASAPPQTFVYSYKMASGAPGAFLLTTEFNLDLTTFGELGTFWIQLSVDNDLVEQTPLTLLRKH